jgi:hypothetical protein
MFKEGIRITVMSLARAGKDGGRRDKQFVEGVTPLNPPPIA